MSRLIVYLVMLTTLHLAVRARPTACSDGSIQLAQQAKVNTKFGVSYYGIIKICINKHWGYICSNGWDYVDAKVACIDLGFSPYGALYRTFDRVSVNSPVLLTNVQCRGDEIDLSECIANVIGNDSNFQSGHHSDNEDINPSSGSGDNVGSGHFDIKCSTGKLAGVVCQTSFKHDICNTGDVRLSDRKEGRVELCINNVWTGVCNNSWDNVDASVVCKQLGFPAENATAVNGYRLNGTILPIFFDNIECNLNSLSILNCSYQILGEDTCGIHQIAGVICQVCNEGAIRLLASNGQPIKTYNTSEMTKGIVQFCIDNEWTVICDTVNFWTKYEAKLVCQQLGYSSQDAMAQHLSMDIIPIILPQAVRCDGTVSQTQLLHCIQPSTKAHCSDHNTLSALYAAVQCRNRIK